MANIIVPGKTERAMRDILKEFDNGYRRAVQRELVDPVQREDTLRVSGFPYCGLRHLYKRLIGYSRPVDFGADYYTKVGTVTHESLQHWLGYTGTMYGMWVCRKRKCTGRREFSAKNKCPVCGSIMEYQEFEVRALNHISGHIDGVFRAENGKYFIIDYKTSSVHSIQSNWKTHQLPYAYNVAQIKAYCALLELIWDVEISGWILHYVARDKPTTCTLPTGDFISRKEKALLLDEMKVWDRHYEHVMVHVERLQDVKLLIDEKPCRCAEDYRARYDSIEGCPLGKTGICFNRDELRTTLKSAWADKAPNWQSLNMPRYLKKMFWAP